MHAATTSANERPPQLDDHQEQPSGQFFLSFTQRTPLLILAILAISAALAVPLLTMAPDESASTEPSGAVFDARDKINDRFAGSVFQTGLIAVPEGGDALAAAPLRALLDAGDRLREDTDLGPTLFSWYSVDGDIEAAGPLGLAELVDAELTRSGVVGGLGAATDADVKAAGAALIERHGPANDLLGLSQQTTRTDDGEWIVPALFVPVLSDDTVLGFGAVEVNLGGDTAPEQYARDIQEAMRSADGWQVNGIAIDVNLTSEEQGAVAGPFIGLTVLAALLLVGLTFRSYWVLAVVSVAFLILLIWLKGISNLVGFKDDLILSLIVPIAMISFGVDYAFHSIGRYREERAEGRSARAAVAAGGAAVSGALLLATLSDSVAFLANVTAGIESVVQFGLGAAIALVSAWLLLGLAAPPAIAWIEARVPAPTPGRRSTALRLLGSSLAAMLAMAGVLMLVFVLPWLGVALTGAAILLTLVVPVAVRSRQPGIRVGDAPVTVGAERLGPPIGRFIEAVARRRPIVLAVAAVITAFAAVLAVQVPARFDVEDFFSPDTDFVISLELLDEHVGERNGEPASLYIEGDLTDPAVLAAISSRVVELRALDIDSFARDESGVRLFGYGILEVFDQTWESPVMADLVAAETGVALTDTDSNGIPDSRSQIEALIETATLVGIPLDDQRLLMTPNDIAVRIDLGNDEPDATVINLAIVNSRDQGSVRASGEALTPIAESLSADLGGSFVQSTGSPLVREASLEGTNRALLVSLPIALLACLTVAALFLRSLRYGVASVLPILMVVSWLYAFMELAGYAINLVTATIAAVSIGIGIDFALHFISRYREELGRTSDPYQAIRKAGEGTGLALVASAISSAGGFGILAFAPMPLFAAYGLLTAIMILMALAATLLVLPSILLVISHSD